LRTMAYKNSLESAAARRLDQPINTRPEHGRAVLPDMLAWRDNRMMARAMANCAAMDRPRR